MYLSTALVLASGAGLATAHPLSLFSRGVATFAAGSSWDILLSKGDGVSNVKQAISENFQVIDIDLFDTDAATIGDLKANKKVICYFSAGSKEGWRSDAGDFKDGDTGKGLDGWPDETWVNVKSENVRNIMKKRIQKAADSGCTAIDPDNVDGFDGGQDGFGYDKSAYVDYVKFMAQEAASHNLAIGLKNAVDMIPDVVDVVQFAVNEQCHQYSGECEKYKPFTDANKAVFNIEYGGDNCASPSGVTLSTLIKPEDQGLNTLGGACSGSTTGATPTNEGNSPSAAPSQTDTEEEAVSSAPTQAVEEKETPSFTLEVPQPTSTGTDGEEGEEPISVPTALPTGHPSRTITFSGSHPTGFPRPSGGFPHHSHNGTHHTIMPHPTAVATAFPQGGRNPSRTISALPTTTDTEGPNENEQSPEEQEGQEPEEQDPEDEEE